MLLILNAAEDSLHFLLAGLDPPAPLCSQRWRLPSRGAEILAPALAQALSALRLSPKSLARVACVRGPGSFSGLRLALVTAAGLARCSSALLAGLDYLPLLAAQGAELLERTDKVGDVFWTLTRARRGVVHAQGFVRTAEGDVLAEGAILATPLKEAAGIIARRHALKGGRALLLGSGLTENRAAWERLRPLLPDGSVFLPPPFDSPGDGILLRAAAKAAYSSRDIQPLYVRPSDAEENLESSSAELGLDPFAARRRLRTLTGQK
jgi:tRNA threonylcarbamoyl adenosine modification protein YeaZ